MTLLLLSACVIGGDRWPKPRELGQAWLVDRTRVLAVRADPPEAFPNTTVVFEALIGRPPEDTEELATVWIACPSDDEGGSSTFGCLSALEAGTLDTGATPATPDETTILAIEPDTLPVYQTPAELLVGLDEQQAREGVYVLIQAAVLPISLLESGIALADIDVSDVELAYKRLVVSLATTPNHNPTIEHFTVEGITVPAEARVQIEAGESYELGVTIPDGTREVYTYLNTDGVEEERVEEPYATFSTTSGEVFGSVTLWPYMSATFVAPDERGTTGTWFVVIRDRRGGIGWWLQEWDVL